MRLRDERLGALHLFANETTGLIAADQVLAQALAGGLDMDAAFALLRGYARHHNLLLSEVARRVIDREIVADALVIQPRPRASRRR